ncbi:MAG: TonB-dependent receptor plug domain-containing protein, partial [Flavobacteriales bacterium]|nr:TonB-dependent receptor plug domain-containing protein [Flavobacteriales bacterium]
GSEGTSGLYVRGGGPDQNLILLDGVPIYNASHLFGFFSVFNADAINSVKLIKGGFPARYGGRLSSVIDIKMKEGNMKEFHGEGSIGLISSKLTLEGPIKKDKTSFLISGRRTYIDLLARPLIKSIGEGVTAGYYFYDLNAKVNHKFSDKDRLYVSAYMGDDKAYTNISESWTNGGSNYSYTEEAQLKWGNLITAVRWNHMVSNKIFMNTTLRYSKYRFLVGADETNSETTGGTTNTNSFSYAYKSGIEDWSGKVDFDWVPNPNHFVRFGAGDIYHTFTPGVNQYQVTESNASAIDTTFGADKEFAHELFAYIEDEIKIGERLKGNAGLHFSGFLVGSKNYWSLQPRINGRYLLNDVSSIKASYASMTQFMHLLTNAGIGLPTDLWLPATERVKPQTAHQWAAGYARTFKKKYEVSVEGYYKIMNNLIEYKDGASFFSTEQDWQDKIEVGRGWSYGGELLIEKKIGKTTGWIGYTLAWTNRQFENLNFGEVFPYRYDRRHDIGAALTHEFNDRVSVGVVWVYGTGNAVTLGLERYQSVYGTQFGWGGEIEHIESRNNYRMPAYHRLDVSVNLKKEMKWGERTWSFGVYNVYSRQNPFYLAFGYDDTGNRKLYQYSLFPFIPSFNYAFKF